MDSGQGVKKLVGVVQNYSWGGYDFLSSLLDQSNRENKPMAEYWLGAHPQHSALLENTSTIPLEAAIRQNPKALLGDRVAAHFDSLPYLLKVLDVREMLSIQVHPDKKSAAAGFEAEEKQGVSISAHNRNYKDRNHKPELMVALGDFWLLHGFRTGDELISVIKQVPEWSSLLEIYEKNSYEGLYKTVMQLEQDEVNRLLEPLIQRLLPLYRAEKLKKDDPGYWAARAALRFCGDGQYDRGIFSIYFFNLLHLKKGEGIYQPSGLPHAYLEGQNVEVMANSDNVLRAGLTDKYIDVDELMTHVRFEATIPSILQPENTGHTIFSSPAEEFELHQYRLDKEEVITSEAGEVWLLTSGKLRLSGSGNIDLKKGEAVFVPAGTRVQLQPEITSVLYRVTVPWKKQI
jgi:mannose-6-phosphate isomerase